MAVKKVIVSTVDTRKFVEYLLYLGSVGGKLTKKCIAMKGMFLRAEVEVAADTIIKQTPEMKVVAGPEYEAKEEKKEEPTKDVVEDKKPTRGRKPKVEEVFSEG